MTNFYASRLYTDTISNGSQIAGIFCSAFPRYSGCHHAPLHQTIFSVSTPRWGSSTSVAQGPWFEDSPRKPCLILFNNMICNNFSSVTTVVGVDVSSRTTVWKPCLILLNNIWCNFERERENFPKLLPRCSKIIAQKPWFRSHV